jgi:ABC-type oligopeptide transport system ATPase subunit
MQLPIEMVIGESGSGKSTLCELRLAIVTGQPKLRNSPTDLKDWHASIASTGGLHVTDNVQLVDRNLRQRLSDEICRIITEPEPTIEQRKLYTNADVVRLPVRSVFVITSIQQPFQNADLLQRAFILELDKMANEDGDHPEIMYDSEWRQHQLDAFGGREAWVAHHLDVLQRFFKLVKAKWDPKYRAKHRLIHFEQAMLLMAEVFGIEASWIPKYLAAIVDNTLSESDWTFEGIKMFVDTQGAHYYSTAKVFAANDISEWAKYEDDFSACEMLTNPRRLARYLQTHKSVIAISCCLVEAGKKSNKQMYKIVSPKK